MSEPKFAIFLDPVSGETLKWSIWSQSSPNLMRGPYIDEEGHDYYLEMILVWPQTAAQEEKE